MRQGRHGCSLRRPCGLRRVRPTSYPARFAVPVDPEGVLADDL